MQMLIAVSEILILTQYDLLEIFQKIKFRLLTNYNRHILLLKIVSSLILNSFIQRKIIILIFLINIAMLKSVFE